MKFHELVIGSLLLAAAVVWHTNARADTPAGQALFVKNCAACHQPTGKGIPGAFPALAGNTFVQGPSRDPASVLLKGRGGMPNFSGSLDDAEIAQVLSYVRSSWGNSAAPLSQDEVSALRTELQVPPASHSRFGNKH